MVNRLFLSLLLFFLLVPLVLQGQSDSSRVSYRKLGVNWKNNVPFLSYSARDFVNAFVVKRFQSGLPQSVITRTYAYSDKDHSAISVSIRSCKVTYDLWEERHGVHTYTVAAVIAGLRGAANFARVFRESSRAELYDSVADDMTDGIAKHLYHEGHRRYARSGYRTADGYELDEVVDISVLALVTLGVLPARDERVVATVEAIRRDLVLDTKIGGVARYRGDQYQREDDVPDAVPGNPWFISTLWLGEYEIMRAHTVSELREALPYLEWCAKNALPSGVLAEQVHPISGHPLSVSPLTWSHSAFVWAVQSYVEKSRLLRREE